MKIKKQKNNKKIILVCALVAILVVAAILIGLYFYNKNNSSDKINNSESQEGQTSEFGYIAGTDSDEADPDKKTPVQYDGENPNDNPSLTGVVNYKSIVDDQLVIRVTIDQSLSSGTCSLKMTNAAGSVLEKNTSIVANPSSSACNGFDIPLSELSSGNWRITISLSGGDKTGVVESEVDI